jgi:hypothetical protein
MGAGIKLILEPEAAIIHAVNQDLSQLDFGDIVVDVTPEVELST